MATTTRVYSVGTTAMQLLTPNPKRRSANIENLGNVVIYIADAARIDTTAAYPLQPGASLSIQGAEDGVWAWAASSTQNVAIVESTSWLFWLMSLFTVIHHVLEPVTTYHFTNVTSIGSTPDTDTAIDIEKAEIIVIRVDSLTDTNHTATDWDLNVLTSDDGTLYDSTAFAEINAGNDEKKTFLVNPGPKYMKLTCDENAALRADPYVYVRVRR